MYFQPLRGANTSGSRRPAARNPISLRKASFACAGSMTLRSCGPSLPSSSAWNSNIGSASPAAQASSQSRPLRITEGPLGSPKRTRAMPIGQTPASLPYRRMPSMVASSGNGSAGVASPHQRAKCSAYGATSSSMSDRARAPSAPDGSSACARRCSSIASRRSPDSRASNTACCSRLRSSPRPGARSGSMSSPAFSISARTPCADAELFRRRQQEAAQVFQRQFGFRFVRHRQRRSGGHPGRQRGACARQPPGRRMPSRVVTEMARILAAERGGRERLQRVPQHQRIGIGALVVRGRRGQQFGHDSRRLARAAVARVGADPADMKHILRRREQLQNR